jgi:glutathionyl-hydroquinone reductase
LTIQTFVRFKCTVFSLKAYENMSIFLTKIYSPVINSRTPIFTEINKYYLETKTYS